MEMLEKPWEKIRFDIPESTLDVDLLRLDYWKKLIDTISNLTRINEENCHPDLKKFLALIIEINQSDLPLKKIFPTPEILSTFLDTIFPNITKNLFHQKYFFCDSTLEISNHILENLLYLTIKHLPTDNIKLLDLMRLIIDPEKPYYKHNNVPYEYHSQSSVKVK
jgi:hypothetical protein